MALTAVEQLWLNRLVQAEDDPEIGGGGFPLRMLVKMYRQMDTLQDRVDFLEAETEWMRFHQDKARVYLKLTPSGTEFK